MRIADSLTRIAVNGFRDRIERIESNPSAPRPRLGGGEDTELQDDRMGTGNHPNEGQVKEILRQGDLSSREAKAELWRRDVSFVRSYDRALSALFLGLAVLWLLPGVAHWSGWPPLSPLARLARVNFPTPVIVAGWILVIAAFALDVKLAAIRQRQGGCHDTHETVVLFHNGPYAVIRHPGYLAEMVYLGLLPVVVVQEVDAAVVDRRGGVAFSEIHGPQDFRLLAGPAVQKSNRIRADVVELGASKARPAGAFRQTGGWFGRWLEVGQTDKPLSDADGFGCLSRRYLRLAVQARHEQHQFFRRPVGKPPAQNGNGDQSE